MQEPLSKKQLQFIVEAQAKWNLAHGAVRTGKTVGTLFAFMHDVDKCQDSDIYMVGHSSTTIYENAIKLLFDSPQFAIYRPFCSWSPGNRILTFKGKKIKAYGAADEGAVGNFQGKTMSLVYCDEITLYPQSIIEMIDSRLSNRWSKGYASMNPTYPDHVVKKWIDLAEQGDKNYYAMHFTLDDNPYVDEDYKQRLKNNTSGLFYKRNYLGLWCLAEGAIFDFFDTKIHVVDKPPAPAEYWVAGIDYGISNAFACVLIGVYSGQKDQRGKRLWVEKEYYWDCKKQGRQKLNSEFADDMQDFLEPYSVKSIYIDPSAAAMKLELRRRGMHIIDANNDVYNGIETMTNEMAKGNLYVLSECKNTIREIQNYVWDSKKSKQGDDEPVKKGDHAVDALRYAIASHKVAVYDPYAQTMQQKEWQQNKYAVTRNR
jgi:PBSX family phage terminase large subunit